MIIVFGEIFLCSISFLAYLMYRETFKKKIFLFILEFLALGIFVYCNALIVADIPYIINGGLKVDSEVGYVDSNRWGTSLETEDGNKYYAADGQRHGEPSWVTSVEVAEQGEIELYVLPNTKLIYRIVKVKDLFLNKILADDNANNKYVYQLAKMPPYDLYTIGEFTFIICELLIIDIAVWYSIYRSLKPYSKSAQKPPK